MSDSINHVVNAELECLVRNIDGYPTGSRPLPIVAYVMIEIHDDPENAFSDGPQALLPETYIDLVSELKIIANAIGRKL